MAKKVRLNVYYLLTSYKEKYQECDSRQNILIESLFLITLRLEAILGITFLASCLSFSESNESIHYMWNYEGNVGFF